MPPTTKNTILTKNQPSIKQFFTNPGLSNKRRDTIDEEPENLTTKSPFIAENIENKEQFTLMTKP